MNIIDIAAAIGPMVTRGRAFKEAAELLNYMDEYNLTQAVAYHTYAKNDPAVGNNLIFEMAKKSNGRIRHCFVIDPPLDSNNLPSADAFIKELSIVRPAAVRLFPHSQKLPLDPFYCGEIFEIFDALEIPVILESGEYSFTELPALLKEFKKVKLVLLRPGLNMARVTYSLLRKTENVYFDISTMDDAGLLDELVNKFGAERFLFSSGLPQFEPSGPLGLVKYARISDGDKEKILGINWLKMEADTKWII
ncbi:MAG: hypothetical protein K0S55_1416 [Clostridia bacterium]|nr:hypothetical protein [Clostridia bacterium]